MPFYPGPGFPPWDALLAAGFRCTADPRNLAPPVVLFEVAEQQVTGVASDGCLVVEGVCNVTPLATAPDNGDARKWLWSGPVPVLMPHANGRAEPSTVEEMPGVRVPVPFTYKQEV